MNVGCCLGDYVIQTRPAEYVETRDASGKVVSDVMVTPAQTVTVSAAKPKDKTLPVLAAIAAAYLLLS